MKRLLFGVAALIALATGLVAMAEPASAETSAAACGSTITTDTVLRADVTCAGSSYIEVAEGVTLDLNHHRVTNHGMSSCGAGLLDPQPDAAGCAVAAEGTVRNGTIIGGVYSSGVVENVLVSGGAAIASGVIRSSVVTDGLVNGVQGVTVENSTLLRSGMSVGNFNFGLGVEVHGNVIVDGLSDGISLHIDNFPFPDDIQGSITGNLIVHSGGRGIAAGGGFSDFAPFEVARNVVWGSKGDGIDWPGEEQNPAIPTSLSGPMSVHDNWTFFNGGHGIVTGPITIGNTRGNVALFNRTQPQCVGVRCSSFIRF